MAIPEVRKLTKRYRRVPVVNEVSFSVRSGEITGYLCPNGLTGLVEASAGHILLDGAGVRRDFIGFKQRLGYVHEEAHVDPPLSGMEYLQLMGRLRALHEKGVNEKATDLLKLPSLEEIFAQFVQHEDMEAVAKDIARAISGRG